MSRKMTIVIVAGIAGALGLSSGSRAQVVLEATADATVDTDTDKRAADNYGCDPFLKIGPSRGGGGISYGDPDAMRALILFDVGMFGQPVTQAVMELTISGFGLQGVPRVHTLDVHRVIPSATRTPWEEGDGDDAGTMGVIAPGCTDPDAAFGVAWLGVEDGADANNHSQPDFDPTVYATAAVNEPAAVPGDVIQWDVTSLVNEWVTGAQPNLGLVIRDPTSNGTFHHIILTSRDAELWNGWTGRNWTPVGLGPRLEVMVAIAVARESWGRVKSRYR